MKVHKVYNDGEFIGTLPEKRFTMIRGRETYEWVKEYFKSLGFKIGMFTVNTITVWED